MLIWPSFPTYIMRTSLRRCGGVQLKRNIFSQSKLVGVTHAIALTNPTDEFSSYDLIFLMVTTKDIQV